MLALFVSNRYTVEPIVKGHLRSGYVDESVAIGKR
jgi:hypothetical protein